jgi:hypothetical protein
MEIEFCPREQIRFFVIVRHQGDCFLRTHRHSLKVHREAPFALSARIDERVGTSQAGAETAGSPYRMSE